MVDYQKYINALRKCAKEHDNDRTSFAHIRVSDLCRDTANLLEEVEQEYSSDLITGHWKLEYRDCGTEFYICDRCNKGKAVIDGDNYKSLDEFKICPNCGCRMIRSQESEE